MIITVTIRNEVLSSNDFIYLHIFFKADEMIKRSPLDFRLVRAVLRDLSVCLDQDGRQIIWHFFILFNDTVDF
jgi:hypothetical protein